MTTEEIEAEWEFVQKWFRRRFWWIRQGTWRWEKLYDGMVNGFTSALRLWDQKRPFRKWMALCVFREWLKVAQFFSRQKRGLCREQYLDPKSPPTANPDHHADACEYWEWCLTWLSPQERQFVTLYFQTNSHAETGQALGVSWGRAQQIVSGALAKLRARITTGGNRCTM